jgi:hypothetical protein
VGYCHQVNLQKKVGAQRCVATLLTGELLKPCPLKKDVEMSDLLVGVIWEFKVKEDLMEVVLEWNYPLNFGGLAGVQVQSGKWIERFDPLGSEREWRIPIRLETDKKTVYLQPASEGIRGQWVEEDLMMRFYKSRWIGCGLLFFAGLGYKYGGSQKKLALAVVGILGLVIFCLLKFEKKYDLNQLPEQIRELLVHVYSSASEAEDSVRYDRLAKVVKGELLRNIFLEVRAAMILEEREQTQTHLQQLICEVKKVNQVGGVLEVDCEWTILAGVNHWGHRHDRINRYNAGLKLEEKDGFLYLTELKVNRVWRR